jgi:tripartite-type tricarboxylate transporter receptor subunit TctC
MRVSRRRFLSVAACATALPAAARIACAQSYPARPVRLIVGLAAGGGQDIVARLLAQWLSERLGRQFIVENRPGAAGNLALEAVAAAPPDGYTLALLGVNNAINASLTASLASSFCATSCRSPASCACRW